MGLMLFPNVSSWFDCKYREFYNISIINANIRGGEDKELQRVVGGFQGQSPNDICRNGLHSRCKGAAHRKMVSEMSFKEITHEIICKQKTYSSLIR